MHVDFEQWVGEKYVSKNLQAKEVIIESKTFERSSGIECERLLNDIHNLKCRCHSNCF